MAKRPKYQPEGQLTSPQWEPESDWLAPRLGDLPDWSLAKRIAIDTETCDPYLKELGPSVRRGGFIAGYSFAIEDGPSFYVPLRHQGGGNVDVDMGLHYLRTQSAAFKGTLVGANLPYDLDYLEEAGVTFPQVEWFRDIQLAEPLLDELQMQYSLDAIAGRHGIPGKDETLLREAAEAWNIDPKASMWRLPARFVGAYAEQDAALPLQLLRRQERMIEDQGLQDIYNLESQVLPVLLKMRRRGVRIDEERLEKIETWSLYEEKAALWQLYNLTGVKIEVGDVWKAKACAPALEQAGVKLPRTPTGKASLKAEILEQCGHPAGELLIKARKANKLRTTFATSIRRHMVDGRIHANMNQMARDDGSGGVMGARYGRMSSHNPNIQQQPSRDQFAAMWRSIYLPEEGSVWACLDYSQQEPRLLTHYAYLARCEGAEAAVKMFRDDPRTDNHKMMAELCGIDRDPAKTIYLGVCYGMGGGKMCKRLGLSTVMKTIRGRAMEMAGPEGQAIIDKFDSRAPYVREIARKAQGAASQRGFIKTLLGRHCHFPKGGQGYEWTHKALNRLIQGGSADQMKQAMVEMDREGYFLQLQVHDEVDGSFESEAQARQCAEIMRDCVKLEVPSVVDVECGPSWGEIKKAA